MAATGRRRLTAQAFAAKPKNKDQVRKGKEGKPPVLLYLYAEPERRGANRIPAEAHARHRTEIADFAAAVAKAEVRFAACSYREWLSGWTGNVRLHADALTAHFQP